MKKRTVLTVLLLILTTAYSYSQCSMISRPLDQRLVDSELVIEGEVIDQKGVWNTEQSMIHTINTIKVFKVFKGTITTEYIEVLTQGGTVGLTHDRVSVALRLRRGDVGLFTLRANSSTVKSSNPIFEVLGRQQGFVAYSRLDGTASDFQSRFSSIQDELYPYISGVTRSAY